MAVARATVTNLRIAIFYIWDSDGLLASLSYAITKIQSEMNQYCKEILPSNLRGNVIYNMYSSAELKGSSLRNDNNLVSEASDTREQHLNRSPSCPSTAEVRFNFRRDFSVAS